MTNNTSKSAASLLARPWYKVHPTHRYARMVDASVASPSAWLAIATRLENQARYEQGDRSVFTMDRAYDAYQRAGLTAQAAWIMTH